ncbi:MAG TPA: ATP-binding protein [Candidatus Dormibacteraeota bacterium]|nr:ATP-binding protein [Candidatus Dormibacteraeota bacterium]
MVTGTENLPAPFRVLGPSPLSALVSIDDRGIVVRWSSEAELVFGWSAEQVLGRRLSETIIPERFRAAHEEGLHRFRSTGTGMALGRVIEARALRADGTEFAAELNISPPVRGDDGGHVFTAFVRDLTERHRLEQLHAMHFQVTRVLVESATLEAAAPAVLAAIGSNLWFDAGLLWVVDRGASMLRLHTAWARSGFDMGGFEAASRATLLAPDVGLPGRVWSSAAPVAVSDVTTDPGFLRTDAAVRAGLRGAAGFPIVSTNGVAGVVEFFTAEAQIPDPLVLSTMTELGSQLGQFVEHRLAEELLRRRLHELEVLQRAAHALSASLDLDVVLDAVARSAAEALDAPRATVLRLDGDMLEIAGEYDASGTSARGSRWPISDLPGAGRVLGGEFWTGLLEGPGPALRRVADRTGVAALAMAPMRSGSEPFGILALLSRTPRTLGEGEMRLLHGIASLAGLAVGNAESFRLEREHGRRMAALDTAKSQFLNLASHELRSPLTVLRGYLSMIAEGTLGPLPDGVARVVPMLTAKLTQMNNLVDEMLETARLEDNLLELSFERVDMREVVAAAVRSSQSSLQPERRVVLEMTDRAVVVEADPARLETALKNLVDNALKYSPGAADVECTVSAGDGRATVSVRDHGFGIAPEDMDRLFTRFGRIVTAENSHIQGTGLGLYLARELVRMQGGDITAESAPGEGSVFTLWLPLAPR